MHYYAPQSLAEASELLAANKAKVLAGGTDLLTRAVQGGDWPDVLVDIKHIPELAAMQRDDDGSWVLGAAVCGAELSANSRFCNEWPGVAEAMDLIGSVQIQGRATPGGNLCNASPAADAVPALLASRAVCRIKGPDGERQLPVEEIIVAPGKTCLRHDEFLVSLRLPPRLPHSADAYLRMTPRTEMDIAIAGAGVNLILDGKAVIKECYVALGAVSPVPMLAKAAASTLLGVHLEAGSDVLSRFKRHVSGACRPISDKRGTAEYRAEVVAVLAARAAQIAWRRALDIDVAQRS